MKVRKMTTYVYPNVYGGNYRDNMCIGSQRKNNFHKS